MKVLWLVLVLALVFGSGCSEEEERVGKSEASGDGVVIRFPGDREYGGETDWSEILYRDKGYSICCDAKGRVYVGDREDCKVHIFDESGRLIKSFGQRGEGPGDFQYPNGVGIYGDKYLLVKEATFFRSVSIHDLEGNFIRKFRPEYAPYRAVLWGDERLVLTASGVLRNYDELMRKTKLFIMTGDAYHEFRSMMKPSEFFFYSKNKEGNAVPGEINFAGELVYAVLPNEELMVGDSDTDVLEFFDTDLKLIRSVKLNLERPGLANDYIEKCKKKAQEIHKMRISKMPGMLKAYQDWEITSKTLPYYRKLKVTGEGKMVVFLNDEVVVPRIQKIVMFTPEGKRVYEATMHTGDFDLDYNSYDFFINDYFAFTGDYVFALLPVIDEEENTTYRVFRSKLK